jgi:hypothetical protein
MVLAQTFTQTPLPERCVAAYLLIPIVPGGFGLLLCRKPDPLDSLPTPAARKET